MSKFLFIGRNGCEVREVIDSGAAIKILFKNNETTDWDYSYDEELFLCRTVMYCGVEFNVFCSELLSNNELLEKLINHLPNTFNRWKSIDNDSERHSKTISTGISI